MIDPLIEITSAGYKESDAPAGEKATARYRWFSKGYDDVVTEYYRTGPTFATNPLKLLHVPGDPRFDSPWMDIFYHDRIVAYDDRAFGRCAAELKRIMDLTRRRPHSPSGKSWGWSDVVEASRPGLDLVPPVRRLLVPADAAVIDRFFAWEKQYENFVRFACPPHPFGSHLYCTDGCKTEKLLNIFWRFIRLCERLSRRLGLGRPRKYDPAFIQKLRARHRKLMGWTRAINAAAREHARQISLSADALPPSAVRVVAKAARVPDIHYVKEILSKPTVRDRLLVEEKLLREHDGMGREALRQLLYRKSLRTRQPASDERS